MKKADRDYAYIETNGVTYKVKKLTMPTDGRVFAWEGLVDEDGVQIVCSEMAIEQVLKDHPNLSKLKTFRRSGAF